MKTLSIVKKHSRSMALSGRVYISEADFSGLVGRVERGETSYVQTGGFIYEVRAHGRVRAGEISLDEFQRTDMYVPVDADIIVEKVDAPPPLEAVTLKVSMRKASAPATISEEYVRQALREIHPAPLTSGQTFAIELTLRDGGATILALRAVDLPGPGLLTADTRIDLVASHESPGLRLAASSPAQGH